MTTYLLPIDLYIHVRTIILHVGTVVVVRSSTKYMYISYFTHNLLALIQSWY